ncbi:MAG: exodeoxyribonuclease VII small subunit [candidate division Zixibacteria bacterium]|nr:exodeoxyribonuclease VII small subunit [candidate division Zixibacteria bacterium]
MAKKTATFEQSLTRLEQIVEQMEAGDLSLDAALALFEEGVEMSRLCARRLHEAEEHVQRLVKVENGKFYLEPFPDLQDEGQESGSDEAKTR